MNIWNFFYWGFILLIEVGIIACAILLDKNGQPDEALNAYGLGIIVGAFILVYFILSLFRKKPDMRAYIVLFLCYTTMIIVSIVTYVSGNRNEGVAILCISSLLSLFAFWAVKRICSQKDDLLEWIMSRQDVLTDTIEDKGNRQYYYKLEYFNLETEIVCYELYLSFVVLGFHFTSNYYKKTTFDASIIKLLCTLLTSAFGFWSLQGLFITPKILYNNITNKNKMTVKETIEILNAN